MSSAPQDILSAGKDFADALTTSLRTKLLSWWHFGVNTDLHHDNVPKPVWQLILSPTLPPLLSPLPSLFRLISFLIVAPVIFICLVDFAGYAIFRTLGECSVGVGWPSPQSHLSAPFQASIDDECESRQSRILPRRLHHPPCLRKRRHLRQRPRMLLLS